MLKKLKTVMASLQQLKQNKKSDNEVFSKEELEFLLQLISESTFKGNDVQLVFETAVKIQKNITNA
jgi:hypothetical protein|tara:strand:- start:227 stop:424 length:198 start_codon:yes stop_codon:yes gene_type:complete